MAKINKGRMFAKLEGDFVVFLIGMRINSLLKPHKWFPVAMAMPRMIKELSAKPDYGFLGANTWFGRTTIMLQYWRSFDHLEAYARNKSLEHFPAWKEFNLKSRQSGTVGIWHETYKISAGNYENIYVNMPSFGLGKSARLLSISEKYDEARNRMSTSNDTRK